MATLPCIVHPYLLGRRRPLGELPRIASRLRPAAFAGFVVVAVALAALGSTFAPTIGSSLGIGPRTDPAATMLDGVDVPAPAPDSGLAPLTARSAGRFRFGAQDLSLSESQELFAYYLSQMAARSWELLSKGDPDASGWDQFWRRGAQTVLVTFAHRPVARLTIDACPPRTYC